jgi:hypothetical protein
MWLLLKHMSGLTSFEDLHTVDGELYPDIKGACISLGLCEDDSKWIESLAEAVQISHLLSSKNCSATSFSIATHQIQREFSISSQVV